MIELVAERGFRGTSMAALAERAGVATGTAYVHYASKDDLIIETYVELKTELGEAALVGIEPGMPRRDAFLRTWRNIHDHLATDPARAGYLAQVDASPYQKAAHRMVLERGDRFAEAGRAFAETIIDLPSGVVWDLAFGPAIRLAADPETDLDDGQLSALAEACWRAVARPEFQALD